MSTKTRLSKNFSVIEFEKSQTAIRKGIDNSMTDNHLANAVKLATNVLQPVRDNFGPTNINSGYRSYNLNLAIGGSTNSQHSKGEAADIECYTATNIEVAEWIKDNLDFDQLILEFYDPYVVDSGWVHVSYRDPEHNRKQVLRAVKQNGKIVYLPGLPR